LEYSAQKVLDHLSKESFSIDQGQSLCSESCYSSINKSFVLSKEFIEKEKQRNRKEAQYYFKHLPRGVGDYKKKYSFEVLTQSQDDESKSELKKEIKSFEPIQASVDLSKYLMNNSQSIVNKSLDISKHPKQNSSFENLAKRSSLKIREERNQTKTNFDDILNDKYQNDELIHDIHERILSLSQKMERNLIDDSPNKIKGTIIHRLSEIHCRKNLF